MDLTCFCEFTKSIEVIASKRDRARSTDRTAMSSKIGLSLDEIIDQEQGTARTGRRFGGKAQSRGRVRRRQRAAHPYRRPRAEAAGGSRQRLGSLKVSGGSNPKSVAGAIANAVREGEAPSLLATGPAAINQCVKAVCIARGYLSDDGVDLRAQPEFADIKSGFKATVRLFKARTKPRGAKYDENDLIVALRSDPRKVAGAMAGRIREGKRVGSLAKGADAVAIMLKSVAYARAYLDEDDKDVIIAPTFVDVDRELGVFRARAHMCDWPDPR